MGKLRRALMLTLLMVLALTLVARGVGVDNRNQALAGRQLADWMGPGVPDWNFGAPAVLADWMGPGIPDWNFGVPALLAVASQPGSQMST